MNNDPRALEQDPDNLMELNKIDQDVLRLVMEKAFTLGSIQRVGDTIGKVISVNAKKHTVSLVITHAIKDRTK